MSLRHLLIRVLLATLGLSGAGEALSARTTTYYHNDGLGSVVAATNEAGQVLWRKDYAPFGEQIDTAADSERQAYTGKPHDDVTGLTYFGARYYDPEIGRFLSVDPVAFVEDNAMSFNRYLYVNNNPYKYVDPDGQIFNFVAKFVFDVGINVALNYATTGEMNIGGALKDSALGVLNPARTLAKAGQLASFAAKTKKAEQAATKSTTRIRHYTNAKGAHGIEQSGRIRASDQNRVFAESAHKKPLSAREAEAKYGLKQGRGRNYVETDVPTNSVERRTNPYTQSEELTVRGDVQLSNPTIVRRP